MALLLGERSFAAKRPKMAQMISIAEKWNFIQLEPQVIANIRRIGTNNPLSTGGDLPHGHRLSSFFSAR
jgi:hypothetical protein